MADHIVTKERDGVLIINLVDARLTEYDQGRGLRSEIECAIDGSATKLVAIDMSKVEMIASVAILPLVGSAGRARDAGGEVVFCNMSPLVQKSLETCHLVVEHRSHAPQIVYVDDVDAAIAKLTG